jgi:hypothetical protein
MTEPPYKRPPPPLIPVNREDSSPPPTQVYNSQDDSLSLSEDDLFTKDDVELLISNIFKFNNSKLARYKSNNQPNHIVNITGRTEVFITSDIHADYRKFVQILVTGGFISIPDVGDLYEGYNIYNPNIISKCEWIKNNCLIVIAGDLVDGKRDQGVVNDPNGFFELLLHLLIFNLRIKGKSNNSNILFTIGNHELETVIANTTTLDAYIHKEAIIFFKSINNRSIILKHFYELNPYVFLVLKTLSMENEVVILHGGLHNDSGSQMNTVELTKLQNSINTGGLSILADYRKNNFEEIYSGPLWTRFYAQHPKDSCNKPSDYALTVVGHCPTSIFTELSDILNTPNYFGCDVSNKNKMKGCVILNCLENPSAPGLPRIALVDVSLSSAFTESYGRHKDLEKVRGIELLHLQHIDRATNRWFNDISRFEINFNCNKTLDIRPSQTGGGNNYKDKYYIYKAKYLNLMKNLKI